MKNNCKCGHHGVAMVLSLLSWLAAVGFFWASWGSGFVMGFDREYFFMTAVVLGILHFSMRSCDCCCGSMHCEACRVDGGSKEM